MSPNGRRRLQGCLSRRSADLAGRSVALSDDIPAVFDTPLGSHHRLIGRWVVVHDSRAELCTRLAARLCIEKIFNVAVLACLEPIELADLRVAVLHGNDDLPPAIAIICESMGQIDLGWIETGDAPMSWRAAAYIALEQSLGRVLPIFGYQDLFEEISHYYWDGETEDEAARQSLIACYGWEEDDLGEMVLPSAMNARRPAWMIAANGACTAQLPVCLRQKLENLRNAHDALNRIEPDSDAWHVDLQAVYDHIPHIEECSTLPPLTLVPVEHFAREVDDFARQGMEMGFMDVAGYCLLVDAGRVDDWLVSLKLGVHLLVCAQDLIGFDPLNS